jgi:hypothetical protein
MSVNPVTSQRDSDSEIAQFLLQRAITKLQYKAAYVPGKLDEPVSTLMPVGDLFAEVAKFKMTRLCDEPIEVCNPRAPYLVLAWLLVGSDNPYRVNQYVANDDRIMCSVAYRLLMIACGIIRTPMELSATVVGWAARNAAGRTGSSEGRAAWEATRDAAWAVGTDARIHGAIWGVARAAGNRIYQLNRKTKTRWQAMQDRDVLHDIVRTAIRRHARAWCHIDDDKAGCIIQSLAADCLAIRL